MLVSENILMCKNTHLRIEVYVCIYQYHVTDMHKPTFIYKTTLNTYIRKRKGHGKTLYLHLCEHTHSIYFSAYFGLMS